MAIFAQTLALLGSLVVPVRAQQERLVVEPIAWRMYNLSPYKVAALFPKFPVLSQGVGSCNERQQDEYAAYAAGAAYRVGVVRKEAVSSSCNAIKPFRFEEIEKRIEAKLKEPGNWKEVDNTSGGVRRIKGENGEEWFIKDEKAMRWYELEVFGRPDAQTAKTVFESFNVNPPSDAIDARGGARSAIGDPFDPKDFDVPEPPPDPKQAGGPKPPSTDVLDPLMIVIKPRTAYTDEARRRNIQGKVLLRVTFRFNGSVGNVEVVNRLDGGLTDVCIASAMKMVFVPPRRNGKPYSVIKPVEYWFTIY